jgi:phenylalanyl-tRNA synthetase beta chain
MNISYNWLRELVPVDLAPEKLRERLTMRGLEVEGIEQVGDDWVLEVAVLSNRADLLSHLGVAREVSVLSGVPLRLPDAAPVQAEGRAENFTAVEIADTDLCPRYAARIVRGVKVGPSPEWLVKRLQAVGQRPINNVADITNYVMLETGQPLHAFDLEKLYERRIVVRRAQAGEKLTTLDDVERELDAEMLVIADGARAVALAGVMGGADSEISATTQDVLIESAYFDAASVRRTARKLGMQTDASDRFERGTDYEGVVHAQARCVALICELAGGTATVDAIDVYPQKIEPPTVVLRLPRVRALTGLSVEPQDTIRILTALGCRPVQAAVLGDAEMHSATSALELAAAHTGATFSFASPSWRTDIRIEEDLIEEVGRHFGYEHMRDELPAANAVGEYRAHEDRRRAARRALVAHSYDEAINFSFIDAAHDKQFELLPALKARAGDSADAFVTLANPINENMSRMRPSLLPGLLAGVRHNFNHGSRDVSLFETGRVFAARSRDEERPYERDALTLVLTGRVREAGRASATREVDFYDLKGALEAAVEAMNIGVLEFAATDARHLRAGQAARVLLAGQPVGTLGRLTDEIAAAYKFRQPVYVAELDFAALLAASPAPPRYTPLPRFPSVVRDVSLLIDRRVTFAELRRTVLDLHVEYCQSVELADVYEGEKLPEGTRSITLRLEYRAPDRTLRDEEVDALDAQIVSALEQQFGAQLRR